MTRIKFCGFTRVDDVALALELEIDAIGLVREKSSPRCLNEAGVLRVVKSCGPFVQIVSVYGKGPGPFTAWKPLGTTLVQATRPLYYYDARPAQIRSLRLPGDIDSAQAVLELGKKAIKDEACVGLLLDALDENSEGGTGKQIDWNVAGEFVLLSPVPVILAGGLTPDNVAEAIRIVKPYAVDVSSGIESSPGVKDHGKMRAFVEAVRSVD